MKLITFLLLISINSWAFEIIRDKDQAFLADKTFGIKEEVISGEGRNIETKDLSSDLLLIRYLDTVAGTSELVEKYNCAVFFKPTKIFLMKDEICKTITKKEMVAPSTEEAKFRIKDEKLYYEFEELKDSYSLNPKS